MGSKQKQSNTQKVDETVTNQRFLDEEFRNKFTNLGDTLTNTFQNRIGQPLELQFAKPFSDSLDPIVQNTISRGTQNIKAAESAANRGLASSLATAGGNNSALLSALKRRGAFQTAGAQNALIPAALEQQRAFDIQRQNILAQQNQQRLQGRAQSVNELLPGLQILQQFRQAANEAGGSTTRRVGTTNTSSRASRSFF